MAEYRVIVPMRVGGIDLEVEATPTAGTEQTSAVGRARDAVVEGFDGARDAIEAVAASTVAAFERAGEASRPDEVAVKFGVKFSAKGSVVIAGAAGEATLEVSLTYRFAERRGKAADGP